MVAIMLIPWTALPPETLEHIIEEFVSREGTDYGHHEYTLSDKVAQVREQLKRRDAWIDFDPDTETLDIRLTVQHPPPAE